MNEERIMLTIKDFEQQKKESISVGVKDAKIPGKLFYVSGTLEDVDLEKIKIVFPNGGFKLISLNDILELRVPA